MKLKRDRLPEHTPRRTQKTIRNKMMRCIFGTSEFLQEQSAPPSPLSAPLSRVPSAR